jgi:hypothetical protein
VGRVWPRRDGRWPAVQQVVRRHFMKFDVFGRFQLEVLREGDRWVAYSVAPGKRSKLNVAIPSALDENEIGGYLDDLYHETARPGDVVRSID